MLSDGNIEYIGRIDNQVKIRGMRIELGEIEATVCEHSSIDQCVVVLKDSAKINPVLTAYLLPSQKDLDLQEVKRFLQARLPDYMLPNQYVVVDAFPLMAHGKIDRQVLAESERAEVE